MCIHLSSGEYNKPHQIDHLFLRSGAWVHFCIVIISINRCKLVDACVVLLWTVHMCDV